MIVKTYKNKTYKYPNERIVTFIALGHKMKLRFRKSDSMDNLRKVNVEGERQTGCMFCLVGEPKHIKVRFNRLKQTHTKQYNFLMDTVGMRKVLEYIGIKPKLF